MTASATRREGAEVTLVCGHAHPLPRFQCQGRRSRREVMMTAQGKIGRWLKLSAPGLLDRMALVVVKDDLRPQ